MLTRFECRNSPTWMKAGFSMESALAEWKSTRVQLSDAVKSYISACNNLGTICARDHQTRARTLAEQAFIQLDTELEALAAEEDALRTARFSLLTLRNKSGTLAPINMLPPEILVQIFALSISNCGHHCRSPPHNFSNTCVYWRQIVLDTPYFWTHIDIGPGIPWQLSKLALERAKTNPLHLHIQGDNILKWSVTARDVHSRAGSLQMELQPFIHRVHSLELSSNNDAGGFLPHLVKLWLSYGDKELAKSLSIYQHIRDEALLDESSEDLTQTSISTRNEVSLSLQTLQLHGARFNWDSSAYRGLVDLQLGFESKSQIGTISSLELVQIFLASPMLAILKLEGLLVTPTTDLCQTVPIPLHHMRVLNLTRMCAISLKRLLPLIALPRTSSAELKVGLAASDEYEEELRGFFSRSSITTLYCICHSDYFDAWSAILEPINTLRTLILNMNTHGLRDDVALSRGSTNSRLSATSRPLSLILKNCCPRSKNLCKLVTKLGAHKLRIETPISIQYYYIGDRSPEEYWLHIRAMLAQAQPELQYTIEEHSGDDNLYQDISVD